MAKNRERKVLSRPHKRPSQARSQFTVQALYEAFVRIWRRQGPAAAGMRAIAEEAGYAVGTLYEYFPNRQAVLSGYFRYCLDDVCRRLREANDEVGATRPWEERLRSMVAATLDVDTPAPYFDADMLLLEADVADGPQHRRAFAMLCETWRLQLSSWPDLPTPSDDVIETLVVHAWGARRYAILLGRRESTWRDVDRTSAMLAALLTTAQAPA